MFREVVDRFQQWIRLQPPPTDWKLDPMTAALPKSLQELPQVKNLEKMEFTRFDGFAMQEAAWLRDVSLWREGMSFTTSIVRGTSSIGPFATFSLSPISPTGFRNCPGKRCYSAAAPPRKWPGSSSSCCGNSILTPRYSESLPKPGRCFIARCKARFKARFSQLVIQEESGVRSASLVRRRAGRGRSLPLRSRARAADSRPGRRNARRKRPISPIRPATLAQVAADAKLLHRLDLDACASLPCHVGRSKAGRRALGGVAAVSLPADEADRIAFDRLAEDGVDDFAQWPGRTLEGRARRQVGIVAVCRSRRSSSA